MSKRLKLLLICALSAVAALCVFSGCNLTNTVEGIISTKHLDAQVTYFANGGVFEDDRNSQKTLYYNAGTLPLDIGEKNNWLYVRFYGFNANNGGKIFGGIFRIQSYRLVPC